MRVCAIDGGIATFGWAVIDDLRIVDFGVSLQGPDKTKNHTDHMIGRAKVNLQIVAAQTNIDLFACEALSLGMANARVQVMAALCVGSLLGLATSKGKPIVFVRPQEWQRAVVPATQKKVDYATVFATVQRAIPRKLLTQWQEIEDEHRNHAADAIAIGMWASTQWSNYR